MSRHLTSLALSASLLLMSSAAFAETTDPLCALVDASLLTALQLADVQAVARKETNAVPGLGNIDVVTCSWESKAVPGPSFSVVSATPADAPAKPVSCNTQQILPGLSVTMCGGVANGSMVMVTFVQKDESDPKVVDTLRSHTEAIAAKLGKTAK